MAPWPLLKPHWLSGCNSWLRWSARQFSTILALTFPTIEWGRSLCGCHTFVDFARAHAHTRTCTRTHTHTDSYQTFCLLHSMHSKYNSHISQKIIITIIILKCMQTYTKNSLSDIDCVQWERIRRIIQVSTLPHCCQIGCREINKAVHIYTGICRNENAKFPWRTR